MTQHTDQHNTNGSFHKETFDKISDEKKLRIFNTAVTEFARKGYNAANINTIARKSGISIGSMYSYFSSKEDLFLAITEQGFGIFNQVIEDVNPEEGTFFEIIERLFRLTIVYAEKHVDLCKLYLTITTEELADQSDRLSERMEISFQEFYHQIMTAAQAKGEIRADADLDSAAFLIDNLVVMLQHSFSLSYYRKRLEKYLGAEKSLDNEALVQTMINFVRTGLSCS